MYWSVKGVFENRRPFFSALSRRARRLCGESSPRKAHRRDAEFAEVAQRLSTSAGDAQLNAADGTRVAGPAMLIVFGAAHEIVFIQSQRAGQLDAGADQKLSGRAMSHCREKAAVPCSQTLVSHRIKIDCDHLLASRQSAGANDALLEKIRNDLARECLRRRRFEA